MSHTGHPMEHMLNEIARFAAAHAMWQHGAHLLVAVSGGPDSLSLLHVLRRLAQTQSLDLHVLHLDHGLRPDSAADAEWVAQTARTWKMPCTVVARDVRPLASQYGGIEAAARAVRYGVMRDLALDLGVAAVLTAHTADDQAETVLLRLLRGAGVTGLAGMRPCLAFGQWCGIGTESSATVPALGPTLVRPMLGVPRTAVETYCDAYTLDPRYDLSNQSPQYLRNRVRGHIIPMLKAYNSSIVATLGRTARICAEEDAFLAELAEAQWKRVAKAVEQRITIEQSDFLMLHAALRRRLLRRSVAEIAPDVSLGADHLDRMMDRAQTPYGRLQLPGTVWMRVARGTIIVERTVGP
jgi:tRNA(Ile)-lysidine synthase